MPPYRHVVGKGGAVNWNEGLHSWLRSQLSRLVRDTKEYTRILAMPVYAITLLMADRTAQFNANLCWEYPSDIEGMVRAVRLICPICPLAAPAGRC